MVFATILKYLPMGDNMKVAFGTSVVLAISYATLARKGTSYDNMAEKREAMKNQELADREAARAARALRTTRAEAFHRAFDEALSPCLRHGNSIDQQRSSPQPQDPRATCS